MKKGYGFLRVLLFSQTIVRATGWFLRAALGMLLSNIGETIRFVLITSSSINRHHKPKLRRIIYKHRIRTVAFIQNEVPAIRRIF